MSKVKLIRRDGAFLPGGYPYIDPKTGMRFDGMECGFDEQVQRIIKHRLANPNLYPASDPQFLSTTKVADVLDEYQCDRLGRSDQYCVGEGAAQKNLSPSYLVNTLGKCSCGGEWEERYCPTCSSKRLVGWTCKVCGKRIEK